MSAGYNNLEITPKGRNLEVRFDLENRSFDTWRPAGDLCVGWHLLDPDTQFCLEECEWKTVEKPIEPGGSHPFSLLVKLPAEDGRYRMYVSPRNHEFGWFYSKKWPFLLLEASVANGEARLERAEVTTTGRLSQRNWPRNARIALTEPWRSLWRNRRLLRSMVRRELIARYRGSFGDLAWTLLHPLLLMLTYFFVFGIVLQARFGQDPSRSGFVLYFLAGMLPWLPLSEAVGRSATVLLEHRNFVKKMVFPLETLPVNLSLAGLVTEAFALAVFLGLLLIARDAISPTVLWLPLLLIPQWLLTAGLCWLLAALGVFLRDLGQILGFVLTLWFFLTPICYPEAQLPGWAHGFLQWNPLYMLVRGYRAILLESSAPHLPGLAALWAVGLGAFLLGHALFWKLRKNFADVI
jgi:lipopolysaccharide transport system permease protein